MLIPLLHRTFGVIITQMPRPHLHLSPAPSPHLRTAPTLPDQLSPACRHPYCGQHNRFFSTTPGPSQMLIRPLVGISNKCDAMSSRFNKNQSIVDRLFQITNFLPCADSTSPIDPSQSAIAVDQQHMLTQGGEPIPKRPRLNLGSTNAVYDSVFCLENITLCDYWEEHYRGRNGKPSLMSLERGGIEWRRDSPGKTASNKKSWCMRVPIYNLMHYHMDTLNMSEEEALEAVQVEFAKVPKISRGKPNAHSLRIMFNKRLRELGGHDSRRYGR